jgi:hypothetical protein
MSRVGQTEFEFSKYEPANAVDQSDKAISRMEFHLILGRPKSGVAFVLVGCKY